MTAAENKTRSPSAVEQAVHTELVRLLFGSPGVPLINGLVALVTARVLWRVFPLPVSLFWLILSLCTVMARLILWSRFKKCGSRTAGMNLGARLFTTATAFTGCLWGLLASTALIKSDPFDCVFAAFVVGGLCAGAAMRLSPHLPSLYAFVGTSAPPMVVVLLLHRGRVSIAMSGLLLTFTVVMILVGRENHRRLADYIRLKIEQEIMNADLQKLTKDLTATATLLKIFVEHAPVALAMFDREMRYLSVSRRWAEDHKVDERAILGRSHYEVNPDIPERWKETHRRGLAGETQRVEEDRYDRSDGRLEWIRWQIIPWRGEDGSVGGIVMLYEEITERKKAEAALRENKELLQLFIDRAPAALAMFDRDMRYLAVSRRWLEDNSLVGKDILGRSHYEVVPDIPDRWKEVHRRCINGETLKGDEEQFERAGGGVQWIRWEVVPWRTSNGSIGGIVLFADDITAQKQTEERLRQAASVFTHAREGILITDPNGLILDANGAFSQITGYSREEVLGQNPRLLRSGLQNGEFYRNMWRSLHETGQWSGEIWNRTKNGEVYAEMLNIGAITDEKGGVTRYVALFSDVTELKNKQRQLERIAHYDVLTGLPNRVLLADRLRQAMVQAHRRKQSVAVAYIDLDEFKQVNDSHGHGTGDQLLRLLATRMEKSLREGDTLARLGGDEFVALLLDLPNAEAAPPVVGRLLRATSQAVEIGSLSLRVSSSIGVAHYSPDEILDADQLLRRADQAMYQAKLAGKNRYHLFDPVQDISVRGRYESLEQIRHALAKGHFVLYYQPKVNMRTGAVVGVEALLRLLHPERGLLPPDEFLPAVEDHPLGIAVGEWVIDAALSQLEIWGKLGLEVPVSVNVSSSQLQDPAFVDRLSTIFNCHPTVRPSRLELEILETSALRDLVQTSEVLEACHRIGVAIALDDFGTGYSSLSYLKRLPAHTLKIDRSFVGTMLESHEDRAIIEGILSLAKVFDRQVLAEGVETTEHGVMLLKMGCDLAQGYCIARPMPASEFPAWLKNWHPDSRWCDVASFTVKSVGVRESRRNLGAG